MSEKSSVSMRQSIATVAGPREWGDTRESWLSRVTRRVPTVSFRTVKALWYGEIQDSDHWAARDIQRAADIIAGRREARAAAAVIAERIEGLRAKDADFYQPEITALVGALRMLGGEDST